MTKYFAILAIVVFHCVDRAVSLPCVEGSTHLKDFLAEILGLKKISAICAKEIYPLKDALAEKLLFNEHALSRPSTKLRGL